ncbi:uncharacterized protein F5147DRAFT_657888 [Suillus discolor]|uniref:Uncharacterized protein n=1 Tax=Suillus discolor TaxID=1912936 RepID=A0A9P7EVK5_9AGAM|nr:uncharacterized protein F5147DRAFT_657888 [Suillus discolor]KAG2091661.1 hypothetical protein F5147DRAFT_657888 [Suillus discolor]
MARPTIHNTAQERIEAREKNKHYYAKHRDAILQRRRMHGVQKRDKEEEAIMKEILRAVAKLHGCDDDESESDTDNSNDDDILSDLPACLHAIKIAKDDMLVLIGADPCEFAKDKLAEYVKSIPDNCSAKGDISIIANSISEIESILKRVTAVQDEILNFCGLSPDSEWHAADTVSRFLKTTVAYLEDIQLLEMSGGVVELTIAQWLGELMYQKGIKI